MDYIIAASLLVIAIAMVFNKPLRIELTHKHITPEPIPETFDPDNQKKLDEQEPINLDKVIGSINEIMGVNIYGNDNDPT